MAVTNFTPLLGLALPTTGDLSGTWGATVNTAITDLIDDAIAGTVTLSADADVTLTTTNGADNQARNAVILWTASNGATTRNITAPAQSKAYIVINAGTGSVVIRGSGPTTGVTVTSGYKALVAWNGSDFVKIASTLVNLASEVTGTLPIANGGTGLTTTPANGALDIGNGTGFTRATLTAGSGVTITNSSGGISIAASGSGGTITSVTASSPLASSGGATPNISFTGTLPIANGGTGAATLAGANIAVTNAAQTFTGGQRGAVTALTSTSNSIAINLATNCNFSYTTTENSTLAAPSNPVAGQSGVIIITQGATPYTLAYNTFYKFAGGTVPTLTATASAVDTFAYYVESATRATCQLIKDVK
jgi:hypothetical protein